MDLYRSPDGHVWDIGELGRRYITHPDVVHAYEANGRDVQLITVDGLATIPRLPDTGLPGWLTAATPPTGAVAAPALTAALTRLMPDRQRPAVDAVVTEIATRLQGR
jgi:hypothetical protein